MQKYIYIFIILFLKSYILFSENNNEYTIIGSFADSIDNVYIYLTPIASDNNITFENNRNNSDSTLVKKGRFLFTGIADNQKNLYSIWSKEYQAMGGLIVIEPGIILYNYQEDSITGGYAYSKGTYLNDLLTDSILSPSIKLAKFGQAVMDGSINMADPEKVGFISEMRNYSKIFTKNILSFINENINNPLGGYIFLLYSQQFNEEDLNNILPNLLENVRKKYYERKELINFSRTFVGQQYIPFVGKKHDNKDLNISDIIKKNKLVVLDFWASWCAPCIKEMPAIVQLYKNYKGKGLEIIGISLDDNELAWKSAIEKNNMLWIQIINNKEKSDNIVEMYGIVQIPYTILINNKGDIIANNLRGKDLIEKIKSFVE